MGMYDNIWCRRVLPDGLDGNVYNFQTKSLDCCLYQFEIRPDGLLVRYDIDEEGNVDRSIPPRLLDYHGYITFYAHITKGAKGDEESAITMWHEYAAKFTDGKLVEIIAAEPPRTL